MVRGLEFDQALKVFSGTKRQMGLGLDMQHWVYGPNKVWQETFRPSAFVCVEVLRPSQPNRVLLSAVSLPNHTFTEQA